MLEPTFLLAAEAGAGESSTSGLLLVAALGAVSFIVGHMTRRWLSEVIVFLGIGIIIGPEVLGVLHQDSLAALDPVIALALGAIVFGIGERLELPALRRLRHTLSPIAVAENLATFGLVFLASILVGLETGTAFLLAAISLSTSPTTLVAVIAERRAKGGFTDHLLAATALNNVTSALIYGLGLPIVLAAKSASGASQGALAFAQLVVASLVVGWAGAWFLRRFMNDMRRAGERLLFVLVVLVGVVAVSRWIGAPVVISTLITGALLANDPRDTRPLFEALRTLEAPIFLVFFLVAGAGVHFTELAQVGGIGLAVVLARGAGKIGGGWLGADLTRSGRRSGWAPWIGGGLMPFAGMAIGLAAFTLEKARAAGVEGLGNDVSAIILGAVVIFELAGPLAVGTALDRTGDSGKDRSEEEDEQDSDAPHLVKHMLVPVSSAEMARRKAPQVVDLAASTGAVLTALHVITPGSSASEDPESSLSYVKQIAASRNVQFEPVVREADSVVDAIVEEATRAAVDLIVLGEPAPRLLDRGGGKRIIHEVAARVPPGVRVMVVPTVLDEQGRPRPAPRQPAAVQEQPERVGER